MENEGLKQLGEAETSRLGQSELEVIKRFVLNDFLSFFLYIKV